MIKKVFLLALFLCTNLAVAQNFEIGLQGGYGTSNIHFDGTSTHSTGVAHVGLIGQYNFTNQWSVVMKSIYEEKGFRYTTTFGDDVKEKLTYIDFPVMAKFYLGNPKDDVRVYFQGGGFLGLFDSVENDSNTIDNGEDIYKDIDYGAAFGLGLDIWLTERLSLLVDVEANIGLADIAESPEQDLTTSATKFGIGLLYSLN